MTITAEGAHFDPETLDSLKAILDDTWASLSSDEQGRINQSVLAGCILRAAATGERDPGRLRASALNGLGHVPSGNATDL